MRHWLAVVLLLFLTPPASALMRGGPAPSLATDTVEALTAESDLVIIGEVLPPLAKDRLQIQIERILKQPSGVKIISPLGPLWWVGAVDEAWHVPNRRLLLFYKSYPVLPNPQWGLIDFVSLDPPYAPKSAQSPTIRDLTLKPLRDARDVVTIVDAEVARIPQTNNVESFFIAPLMLNTLPSDDRLLPAARDWATSSDPRARFLAARVFEVHPDLRYVSDIEALLKDPFQFERPMLTTPWSEHDYVIRRAAAQALTQLHAPFVMPVVEVTGQNYQPFSLSWLVVPWLAPSIALAAVRKARNLKKKMRLTYCKRLMFHATSLCCSGAVILAVLGARSYWTADDVVVAQAGRMVDVNSFLGYLQVVYVRDWPLETPLVHRAITPDLTEKFDDRWGPRFLTTPGQLPASLREIYQAYPLFPYAWGHTLLQIDLWKPSLYYLQNMQALPGTGPIPEAFRVGITYFDLVVICLIFPVCRLLWILSAFTWHHVKARRAAARGLCPHCSYDLRAHLPGDRCPECGHLISTTPPPAPATS